MGCDIHLHIEIKVNERWEHYATPSIQRWYSLFGKMAGVRDEEIKPIADPKGLPDNLNIITKNSYADWELDAHNMSWLSGNELIELSEWLDSLDGDILQNDLEHTILHTYLEGNSFAGFYKYPEDREEWMQDVRFVFWFDN